MGAFKEFDCNWWPEDQLSHRATLVFENEMFLNLLPDLEFRIHGQLFPDSPVKQVELKFDKNSESWLESSGYHDYGQPGSDNYRNRMQFIYKFIENIINWKSSLKLIFPWTGSDRSYLPILEAINDNQDFKVKLQDWFSISGNLEEAIKDFKTLNSILENTTNDRKNIQILYSSDFLDGLAFNCGARKLFEVIEKSKKMGIGFEEYGFVDEIPEEDDEDWDGNSFFALTMDDTNIFMPSGSWDAWNGEPEEWAAALQTILYPEGSQIPQELLD